MKQRVKKNPEIFRSEIYTNFSNIEKEVKKRWNNKRLRKKVDNFFGDKMLSIIKNKPRAVLSRSIGTPNLELKYFLDIVKETKLKPLILEYDGEFVAKNIDKYHLCRLFFFRTLKNKKTIISNTINIVNFNKDEGKYFNKIKTLWGQGIIDFHHELLHKELPKFKNKVVDFSGWFDETKKLSKYYYLYYLSLFVCHGVLFENFLIGDKQEANFIKKKFLPSFRRVEKIFGVKPLIYPLLPFENEKSPFWLSYPESMKKRVDKKMKK